MFFIVVQNIQSNAGTLRSGGVFMRIEANQNNLYGAATQNEKLQGKNKGKGSSYFAGDLNLGVDAIAARKKEAKRQAMKVVADAFSGDRAIDEDLEKRAERIKTLAKERDEAQNQINQIDEKKKALKEEYKISDASQEEKDLALLEKRRILEKNNMGLALTEEEQERLKEIDEQGLTEYQQAVLELNEQRDTFSEIVSTNRVEIYMEEETIKNVNLERLKTHPMVDAQKEVKKIEQSASKEVLGMLMEEGKDHVDEKIEQEKEEAKKAKEKKEEEEIKTKEEKEKDKTEAVDYVTEQILTLNQVNTSVADEVKDIVHKMKLVEEDVKGVEVDELL